MTLMRRHPVWAVVLGVHAVLVLLLLLIVLVLLSITAGQGDFNFGAAVVLQPLMVLGLPWSWQLVGGDVDANGFEALPIVVKVLVTFGSAPLNVVLHAAVFVAVGRRGARRSRAQAPSA